MDGRWPRGRAEWFARVKRKHDGEMIQAEAIGVVSALARGELDIHRDWQAIRRMLTRAYTYKAESLFASMTQNELLALVPFHHCVQAAWDRVPLGGSLQVSWPRRSDPVVVNEGATAVTA